MNKSLYQFSYSPVQKSFTIELCENENDETSPLLISFQTSDNNVIWFNLWSKEGVYNGYIELDDETNFKNCLQYIVELIQNY